MSNDIFIGIDGGASKTRVRIEDGDGNLLAHSVGGPANIRFSVPAAWQAINAAVHEALGLANIPADHKHLQFHAGMGLAGCEIQEAYQAFLAHKHFFKTLKLTSDAHTACLGAHGGKEGAIIIAGTGVVAYEIYKGKGFKIGGWGFPHDDEGSGAWLGMEAARLTFQWLDHRAEKSPLTEDVFSFFNNDMDQFVEWANAANSKEFAKLAPIVINHSQQEEMNAVRLMKKAAHALDKILHSFKKIRDEDDHSLPKCALAGGISPFLEPWLSENLRKIVVPKQYDATAGALFMIRECVQEKVS